MNLMDCLTQLSVINRDNGKKFTCTDRLDVICSVLWNSDYRRLNCDGLFNLYSKKPLEQLAGEKLIIVSTHVDCEESITACFSSVVDDKTLCGTYDNSITNAAIVYSMFMGALPDNVLVAFTGDEEENCKGAKNLFSYLKAKKLNAKAVVILDVTDMGWTEEADFTIENNFWNEALGKKVISIADKMNYVWRFVPENVDKIPDYVSPDKIIYEEAEEDESWFYDEKGQECFSFCLPVSGEMHSDSGVLVLKKVFVNYYNALICLLKEL